MKAAHLIKPSLQKKKELDATKKNGDELEGKTESGQEDSDSDSEKEEEEEEEEEEVNSDGEFMPDPNTKDKETVDV